MTKDEVLGRKSRPSEVSVADGSKFIGAVFLYMFLALLITGVVAIGLGAFFEKFLFNAETSETAANAYVITLIVSLVLYIPMMIITQVTAIKNSKAMVPCYVLYSVIMGIFLSTFTNFVPFTDIAIAFGGTCLAFGLMTLIAWFSKRNLSTLGLIGSGLLFGSFVLLLINLPIMFFFDFAAAIISMIISFAMLIAVILITVIDLRKVKEIAARGGAASNVALLCALSLYVDFIYIFIRLLGLIARLRR